MRRLLSIIAGFLLGLGWASAHERGGHGSTQGLFGFKPEYVHVLLNPLPVYGLAIGEIALIAAWLARSRKAEVIALGLIVVCAAAAWPVLVFGQHGYNHLYPQLDEEAQHTPV